MIREKWDHSVFKFTLSFFLSLVNFCFLFIVLRNIFWQQSMGMKILCSLELPWISQHWSCIAMSSYKPWDGETRVWGAETPLFHPEPLFWVKLTISLNKPLKIFFKWIWVSGCLYCFPEMITRNNNISGISHDVNTLKWEKREVTRRNIPISLPTVLFPLEKNPTAIKLAIFKSSWMIQIAIFQIVYFWFNLLLYLFCARGSWLMYLLHIDLSPPHFLPSFLSL